MAMSAPSPSWRPLLIDERLPPGWPIHYAATLNLSLGATASASGGWHVPHTHAEPSRVHSSDCPQPGGGAATPGGMIESQSSAAQGALLLDESMMVPDEAAPFPAAPTPSLAVLPQAAPSPLASATLPAAPQAAEPAADPSALLAPKAADAAATSMGKLIRALVDQLTPQQVGSGGPTIEDIVREEIRPLLQAWLDANLPPLTEQVVREEIQRLADRAAH